jgi:hypothetical protein
VVEEERKRKNEDDDRESRAKSSSDRSEFGIAHAQPFVPASPSNDSTEKNRSAMAPLEDFYA